MQRASLFEQVNRLAITDPLTGLYNYRKMTRDLDREIVRSRRYHHPFSFIMADIDHFKSLNDQYGHPAGDEVLRAVARTLNRGRREVDRVYRYGGEEFSVLLPETDWPEAFEVAEKLRRKVGEMEVRVKGEPEPIGATISMGVASFSSDSIALEHLISAADEALYSAKESGRNKVVAHSSLTGSGGISATDGEAAEG
jgi:diguanylate cyclase (GGDEF)-like protein